MTETALIDTAMDTALATVRGASVLNVTDAANLDRLAPELRQTWETAQVFRTRTEMEMSVLNDLHFPTPDSKYWQCVREQNVMFGELVGLSFEYRKNRVEQLKELRKIEGETDPWRRAPCSRRCSAGGRVRFDAVRAPRIACAKSRTGTRSRPRCCRV